MFFKFNNPYDIINIYLLFKSPCDSCKFYDENNYQISSYNKRPEQYFITKYLNSDNIVLELRGRYGMASYCIQKN